jgi:hypothetical protein
MARIRDINDIDEDEDGQLVDYSGDSDDDNKSTEDLPEETFRRLDTSQPHEYSILREGDELMVRSNQAFHGKKVHKTLTVHVELGKTSLNFRSRS